MGQRCRGHKDKKETCFALEELPDRQWKQTHRMESSGSWRLGPIALRAEGLCKLGEGADGSILGLSQEV